ncbi:hypothetical protein, partial [Salmonella enterica]
MTKKVAAKGRQIKAKKGLEIECKGWEQEAVLRMLYNNLTAIV